MLYCMAQGIIDRERTVETGGQTDVPVHRRPPQVMSSSLRAWLGCSTIYKDAAVCDDLPIAPDFTDGAEMLGRFFDELVQNYEVSTLPYLDAADILCYSN